MKQEVYDAMARSVERAVHRRVLFNRLERWDRITDWLSYSQKGNALANVGLATAMFAGADVSWTVVGIANGLIVANMVLGWFGQRRFEAAMLALFRELGPCDDPACVACRFMASR